MHCERVKHTHKSLIRLDARSCVHVIIHVNPVFLFKGPLCLDGLRFMGGVHLCAVPSRIGSVRSLLLPRLIHSDCVCVCICEGRRGEDCPRRSEEFPKKSTSPKKSIKRQNDREQRGRLSVLSQGNKKWMSCTCKWVMMSFTRVSHNTKIKEERRRQALEERERGCHMDMKRGERNAT